jgi:hypothetical protein
LKLITSVGAHYGIWEVFTDFLKLSAISLANAVDHGPRRAEREAQYLQTVKRYERKHLDLFPQMLADLVLAMEDQPGNILGQVYGELKLTDKWKGQFFTPDPVSRFMAEILLAGDVQSQIEEKGFITVQEPAIGSGAMVINFALAMKGKGINYQQTMLVTGLDIDIKAIYMSYIQLTLLHIPAILVHGNALSMEVYDTWHTPAYILGGWAGKRQRDQPTEIVQMRPAAPVADKLPAVPSKYELISLFD